MEPGQASHNRQLSIECITNRYADAVTDDLDLADLRAIRAVAETGSITAAAVRLGYSQPAVTQRLRRAEEQIGQPLLRRSGRSVSLTEAGTRLARHAVHVEAALAAARDDLAGLRGVESGSIRLAGFPSASSTLVPAILSALAVAHPGLTTTYIEVEPPEALDLLRRGEVDVALTFGYPGDGRTPGSDPAEPGPRPAGSQHDGITERPLFRDTMLAVAPTGTLGSSLPGPGSSLDDLAVLAGSRFIGGCPRCRGHLLATCRRAGFEPEIILETDNALAVLGLVAAGLGVALLPALSLVPAPVPPGVKTARLPGASDRVLSVAYASGAERIPAIGVAVEIVRTLDHAAFGLRPVSV